MMFLWPDTKKVISLKNLGGVKSKVILEDIVQCLIVEQEKGLSNFKSDSYIHVIVTFQNIFSERKMVDISGVAMI